MQDFEFMQGFKTLDNLDYYLPDVFFLHELLCRLTITDPLEDISIISKLHHNTTVKLLPNEEKVTYHSELDDSSKKASL